MSCASDAASSSCGNGRCNATTSSCLCGDGFGYNDYFVDYANCYFSDAARTAFLLTVGLVSAAACVVAVAAAALSRNQARWLASCALTHGALNGVLVVALYAEDVTGAPRFASALLMNLVMAACIGTSLALALSFAAPVCAFGMTPFDPLKRRCAMVYAAVCAAFTACFLAQAAFLAQGNVRAYNAAAATHYLTTSVYCVWYAAFVGWQSKRLSDVLDSYASRLPPPAAGTSSFDGGRGTDTQDRVARLRKFVVRSGAVTVVLTLVGLVTCFTMAVADYVLGEFPYQFVLAWALYVAVGLFALAVSAYVLVVARSTTTPSVPASAAPLLATTNSSSWHNNPMAKGAY